MIDVVQFLDKETSDMLQQELVELKGWKPFPYAKKDSNPYTYWWGFEWLPEEGGLVQLPWKPMPAMISWLADMFDANAVQANWHRADVPDQGVFMHSDKHEWLTPLTGAPYGVCDSVTISVGADRVLVFAEGDSVQGLPVLENVQDYELYVLTHGSMTIYPLGIHETHLHGVLAGEGERWSVQFRRYQP